MKKNKGGSFITTAAAELTDFSPPITEYDMKMMSYRQLSRGCRTVENWESSATLLIFILMLSAHTAMMFNSASLSYSTA